MADLLPALKELLRLGLDAAEARLPFRLKLAVREHVEDRSPMLVVALQNHTRDELLVVREVRIHYGNKFCDHAFVLQPAERVEVPEGATQEFQLSFRKARAEIQRAMLDSNKPGFLQKEFPTVTGGAELFMAIAYGREEDSWIEIDFNKSFARRFRQGLIKREFVRIGVRIATLPEG